MSETGAATESALRTASRTTLWVSPPASGYTGIMPFRSLFLSAGSNEGLTMDAPIPYLFCTLP